MGKTIIEKIISTKSAGDAKAGDMVMMKLDIRSARDFGGANVIKNFETYYLGETVADPKKTFFTFDCVVPANNIPYANNQQIARVFAKKHGINVFDVDSGIGSHVLIEQAIAGPGKVVVGTDSHLNIMGSVGGFGQGMGDIDIAFAFKTGKSWFEVPQTIKINVKANELIFPVSPRDLTLAIVGKLGAKGGLGKVVELYGEIIDKLDLAGRITLSSMATETGAIAFIIIPNQNIIDFFRKKGQFPDMSIIKSDPDANYSEIINYDFNTLVPLISLPGRPDNVVPVEDVKGKKIDSVFIGSCTNGRFEDFRVVAEIIGDNKISSKVMAKIVPATKAVFGQLISSGLMEKFFKAGFIISNQGCGGCASGQIGMTGKGEIQLSTSNRNFKGKQGDGETYLCSPATAAASALTGVITDPRKV